MQAEAARRAAVEQALYMNRLAGLMQRVDGDAAAEEGQVGRGAAAAPRIKKRPATAGTSASGAGVEAAELAEAEASGAGAVGEVAALLRGRKKKRRAAAAEAEAGEYVPLDPTDWRSKGL